MPTKKKRLITADDLYRFQLVTSCELSPDGQHLVYAQQWVDREAEKKFANLWIAPTSGGEPYQLTAGKQVDSQPHWSPDGKRIAFLSNREDDKQPQLHLIAFGGGEARQLTSLKGEFEAFRWSPDGKKLLCQFRLKDADAIEREGDPRKKELGIVARHIDRVHYKLDGYGYLPRERWHLWTVDVRTGRGKQLTESAVYDEEGPCWSPDGSQIAFLSNHTPEPDLDPDAIDLFLLDPRSGQTRKLDTPPGLKYYPSFSPDGKWLAYAAQEGKGDDWKNKTLWVVPVDGSLPARSLTAAFDLNLNGGVLNDTGSAGILPPTWGPGDGAQPRLYFTVGRHGSSALMSIHLDGSDLQTVIGEPGVVGHYGFDRKGQLLAYFHGEMSDPVQLWVRPVGSTGAPRRLTDLNPWLKEVDLGEIEEVWFKGPDANDLQGWILKPPHFDPARKYPSILQIHGGPITQYGSFFMHEFYFLAAQGYVVYFCNPRGGQGYGEAHARSIWGAWGTTDYADLMAWADLLEKKPYIDPARMGVTGGSYGGYMTNWIIGHTQRFKAAVTGRSVSNFISMWGSSDFNWVFQEQWGGKPPYESIDLLWEQSPIKHIGAARTPTLVMHNQQDLRCAIEQGEQVFVALKRLGVPTELAIFPDEPHGLSRTGRTDRRIERIKSMLGWFDRYLK